MIKAECQLLCCPPALLCAPAPQFVRTHRWALSSQTREGVMPAQHRALLPGGSGTAARSQPVSHPRGHAAPSPALGWGHHTDWAEQPLPTRGRSQPRWDPGALPCLGLTGGCPGPTASPARHTHVVALLKSAFLKLQQSGGRKKAFSMTEN